MKGWLFVAVMLALMFSLAAVSSVDDARSQPAMVVVPDDYPTIQEGINNANEGDTVLVLSGVYYEHVTINKTITLFGENMDSTIIDGNSTGRVVDIVRSNVKLTGFTIRRSGQVYWENAGISIRVADNCNVTGNTLTEHPFAAIDVSQSSDCSVSNNVILNNSGVGIVINGATFTSVRRNSILKNHWGALALNDQANNNTISDNNITENNRDYPDGWTINLYRSCANLMLRNSIRENGNGVRFEYSSDYNTFTHNNVTGNTIGVSLVDSRYNLLNHNILNNTLQASVQGGYENSWDNGYPSGGNYWSDHALVDEYSGPDQNIPGSDDICDSPYAIDENNQDSYPLMQPCVANIPGDVNYDSIVDILDAILLANAFNTSPGHPNWNPNADLNEDNTIDVLDAIILANHFNQRCP